MFTLFKPYYLTLSKPYKSYKTKYDIKYTNLYYNYFKHSILPSYLLTSPNYNKKQITFLLYLPYTKLLTFTGHFMHFIDLKKSYLCTFRSKCRFHSLNTIDIHIITCSIMYLLINSLSAPQHRPKYRITVVPALVFCSQSPNITLYYLLLKLLRIGSPPGQSIVWPECDYGF